MSQCHECENEAVAQGYKQVGPRRSAGEWVPMCARCIGAGMCRKVKALTAAEEQHAAATRMARQSNRSLLDSAVLPGGETWGVKAAPTLGFSSDGEAAMAGKAKRTNAPSDVGAGWGVPTPIVRNDDPWTSHEAARRIEPKRGTRKAAVLGVLQKAQGLWVRGSDLCEPYVGGSEGLRRCRELRQEGWPIERKPDPHSATSWLYRLPGEA